MHALLRIVLGKANLNLQSHTPALTISDRDASGLITITTPRGTLKAKTVLHTTNRWASHLLPEFQSLILGERSTLAAIKAPEGFIKHTGAQHWDSMVNNYHLQLPPPSNAIILGGARQYLVHRPDDCFPNDDEDKQFDGIGQFFASWPRRDVKDWSGPDSAEFGKPEDEGGIWTGMETTSIDSFPFVGAVPKRPGHFIAAGFAGHGMPRILLSTAHLVPLALAELGIEHAAPVLVKEFPSLPKPFEASEERVERLVKTADVSAKVEAFRMRCEESAGKDFCKKWRNVDRKEEKVKGLGCIGQ